MLRESSLEYLRTHAKAGETLQCGWFIFKVIEGEDGLDLISLDFKAIASFTADFQIPEQVHWAQQETLRQLGASLQDCTLANSAQVSRSYRLGALNVYLERCEPVSEGDSGWYVGVINEPHDPDDAKSFVHLSLYELTIHDERFARFWLLPVGYRIFFNNDEPCVEAPEKPKALNEPTCQPGPDCPQFAASMHA